MSIKIILGDKLASITALTALVADRIYSVKLPQGYELPAVVFRMIDDKTARTLGGNSGKARTTFQIVCAATTDTEAETIGEIIRPALDGQRIPGTTSISMTTRSDEYDPDRDMCMRVMNFEIGHNETT